MVIWEGHGKMGKRRDGVKGTQIQMILRSRVSLLRAQGLCDLVLLIWEFAYGDAGVGLDD